VKYQIGDLVKSKSMGEGIIIDFDGTFYKIFWFAPSGISENNITWVTVARIKRVK